MWLGAVLTLYTFHNGVNFLALQRLSSYIHHKILYTHFAKLWDMVKKTERTIRADRGEPCPPSMLKPISTRGPNGGSFTSSYLQAARE
jgi:hypothetical protein